ncbi:phosphatidylserine decarboxylase proenzyme 1, mitochondrial [Cyclospora cayetanensis]|uniref:phosphatidylserine decarboxylase n=1 Tax=Cyclospora cayetanensis TaxID=88456 RepID=A0A6P6RZX6_9EIME|nr:phosphatidylserine decarboxylase proenzyme 1, mitochondrial [Cyclospora cayetanensis]
MSWRIPTSLRPLFTSVFLHLQPSAAADSRYPLEAYESFGQLFCRTLKDRAREVMDLAPLAMVSPCDCTVSVAGVVSGDRVPQVKGATYSLKAFLGVTPQARENHKLMYCVLHLAPHHYHHFHAPCNFSQTVRRHMHGECLPVFRSFLSRFNDIFSVQERVVLSGSWAGGSLHLGAVAACNVGNIRLEKEPDLTTNQDRVVLRHLGGDVEIKTFRDKPLDFEVGAHVGEFRLGSTIVLVFEAPQDFEFSVAAGDKIVAGSRLGGVGPPVVAKDAESRKFLHY